MRIPKRPFFRVLLICIVTLSQFSLAAETDQNDEPETVLKFTLTPPPEDPPNGWPLRIGNEITLTFTPFEESHYNPCKPPPEFNAARCVPILLEHAKITTGPDGNSFKVYRAEQIDKKINNLNAAIKSLSDANDAANKRINDLESRIHALESK